MTENHFDEDDLFESRRESKNEYSTFIEELQESTEKLMNQVFNTQYVPQINHYDLSINDLDVSKTSSKHSPFDSVNRKKNYTASDFNNSKRSVATRCTQKQNELSQSFTNFLIRNQKWKQRRINRAKDQHNRKQEQELKKLTFIPQILQTSREKVIEPIYERCLDIQKQKQKKLALKRIEKEKQENKKQSELTFQPTIINKAKNRTLDQYLKDKEQWNQKKIEHIENQKLWQEAKKTQQCIFRPILMSKRQTKKNHEEKPQGERVEDRLLRSLQKSIEKKEQIMKSTEVTKITKMKVRK